MACTVYTIIRYMNLMKKKPIIKKKNNIKRKKNQVTPGAI